MNSTKVITTTKKNSRESCGKAISGGHLRIRLGKPNLGKLAPPMLDLPMADSLEASSAWSEVSFVVLLEVLWRVLWEALSADLMEEFPPCCPLTLIVGCHC